MSRPRLTIGTFGNINYTTAPSGKIVAQTRYRDWDGRTRSVQTSATTKARAERALKTRLASRSLFQPTPGTLTPDSSFADLVAYWLEDLELTDELSPSTKQLYERNMRTLVLPAFTGLTLREIGVARCDLFLKQLAKQSHNRARQARNVLRLACGLAVRHEILPRNPVDGTSRLKRPATIPDALTPVEVNAIRAAILHWERGLSYSGPRPDGQLGQIVEVMLGTSARIGEVLALRRRDLDVTGPVASVRIAGTVIQVKGEGVTRQDHPKTSKSRRTVAVPTFTAEAIRARLSKLQDSSPDALLFCSRARSPLTTANVRRQLRDALSKAGISGVSPHMFRRTVATAVNEHGGVELAAELLGHTDPRITIKHYIRRNETVDPRTATMLDQVFAKDE